MRRSRASTWPRTGETRRPSPLPEWAAKLVSLCMCSELLGRVSLELQQSPRGSSATTTLTPPCLARLPTSTRLLYHQHTCTTASDSSSSTGASPPLARGRLPAAHASSCLLAGGCGGSRLGGAAGVRLGPGVALLPLQQIPGHGGLQAGLTGQAGRQGLGSRDASSPPLALPCLPV